MRQAERLEDRVSEKYADLSAKLRDAADFVVANQVDVAARTLRSVSAAGNFSPATLSRLARALGFDTYESLRELCRETVSVRSLSFFERAELLKETSNTAEIMFDRQASACIGNVSKLGETLDRTRLALAVEALANARTVVLFGAFGSTGIVEYMAYLANYFSTNWTLAGRMGSSLGAALSSLTAEDVVLVVTKAPYAARAVRAVEIARQSGSQTIVISDSHACPANKFATFPFIVPSESPQFFSSYAASLALMETIIAMLIARSGDRTLERIRDVERQNESLGDFWAD